jgi:TetR/AcrR family transcriptional regulator, ethionamide resistance regulator
VDAANRLLADHRFAELSVDSVMAEAGLARTVFYRHFDSLSQLILDQLEQMAGELFGEIERARQTDDPDAFVRSVLAGAVRAYAEHGPLLCALDDAARTDDEVRAAYCEVGDRSTALTAELLIAGAEAGHNRAFPHPHEAARALTEMNNAYLIAALGREPRSDPAVVLETLVDLWRSALAA